MKEDNILPRKHFQAILCAKSEKTDETFYVQRNSFQQSTLSVKFRELNSCDSD